MKIVRCVAAALLLVGCTGSPEETPLPSSPPASNEGPAPTDEPSEEATDAEPPAPTDVPSRDISVGGTLTVTLGGARAEFSDVQCDTARGLTVVASSGDLSGVHFNVVDDEVRDVSITLPDGPVGVLGGFVGEATYTGDADQFELSGRAAVLSEESPEGEAAATPFRIVGSCEPEDDTQPSGSESPAEPQDDESASP